MAEDRRLLDAAPLVALLSRGDAAHVACTAALSGFPGQLISTEPVLSEALYLLRGWPNAADECLDIFIHGKVILVPMNVRRLHRCRQLMTQYANVPMDFADATLVALAEELDLGRILTLDRRGFGVYRWKRTRRFEILP